MKRKNQLISAALAAVMAVSAVAAGCGSSESSDSGTTAGGTAETTTAPATTMAETTVAAAAETTAGTVTEETQQAAGETGAELLDALPDDQKGSAGNCTLPRSNYVTYPYEGAEGITLRYWLPLPSNISANPDTSDSVQLTKWAERWQELTGVKIEFIHPTQGSDVEEFNTMIAGGTLPDIIEWEWTTSYTGGPEAAQEDGVLIYLDDYITPDGPAADLWQWLQDNPVVDKSVKDDQGHYYCFPFVRGSKYLQCTSGLMYRKDLMDKAGYTGPFETIDDLTAALTALKDYGIEKPMVQQSIDNLQNGTMNAYNIRPGMYVSPDDGKVHYGFAEEGFKDWMKQMNEWVKAGLLDPDVLTCDRSTMETYILTGVGGMCYGAGGGYMGTFLATAKAAPDTYGADFALAGAPFPVLESGTTVQYGDASYDYATTNLSSAAITADCQYPEIAAAFLNFCYSQKGHYEINFGEEGVAYTMGADGPEYTDEIMANPNGLTPAVAMAYHGRANMSGAFVQDPAFIFGFYAEDAQKDALHIWNDGTDSQKTKIPPITMTPDEASEYARIFGDIDTTMKEYRAKWFTMDTNVDDEWDAYIGQLKNQGLDRMIELQQAALDRYNAR